MTDHSLQKKLTARHLNMIAIGGAIGTGLFLASGGTITGAGPLGAIFAYLIIGVMVFFLMQSLGEMAAYIPSPGAFQTYASRFVSRSFGFAQGWNYWYNCVMIVAIELVASSIIMQYWFPESAIPSWVWSLLFLIILFTINSFPVKGFAESEFWFSLIKVCAVIVFLGLGVLMIFGIIGGKSPGLANFIVGEAPFVNGFWGLMSVLMIVGFSFQGTEMFAVAAAESENPEKTVPKATRTVFFRIMLFYVGTAVVIAFLIPYTDPRLYQGANVDPHTVDGVTQAVAFSPFTLLFEKAGLIGAAGVMNAVILTSILSAGNSSLYASTRLLYSMAIARTAPRIFGKLNRWHVPMNALIATSIIGIVCFASSRLGTGVVYTWLLNSAGLTGFVNWLGVSYSHYRFRKAFIAQGHTLDELPFYARWFPLGSIVCFCTCALVIIGQGIDLYTGHFSWLGLFSIYIGVFIFLAIWGIHKLVTRSPKVKPEEADLSTDHSNYPPII